jgi:hypothetical protein
LSPLQRFRKLNPFEAFVLVGSLIGVATAVAEASDGDGVMAVMLLATIAMLAVEETARRWRRRRSETRDAGT